MEIFWEGRIVGLILGNVRKVDFIDSLEEDVKFVGKTVNFMFILGLYMKLLKDLKRRKIFLDLGIKRGKFYWLFGKERGRVSERKTIIVRYFMIRVFVGEREVRLGKVIRFLLYFVLVGNSL